MKVFTKIRGNGRLKKSNSCKFCSLEPREEFHKVALKSKMGRQQFFLFSDDFIWNDSWKKIFTTFLTLVWEILDVGIAMLNFKINHCLSQWLSYSSEKQFYEKKKFFYLIYLSDRFCSTFTHNVTVDEMNYSYTIKVISHGLCFRMKKKSF